MEKFYESLSNVNWIHSSWVHLRDCTPWRKIICRFRGYVQTILNRSSIDGRPTDSTLNNLNFNPSAKGSFFAGTLAKRAAASKQCTVREKNLSSRVYASLQTELLWRCFSKKKAFLQRKQNIYNFLTHSLLIKIWKTNNITEYNNMIWYNIIVWY